MNQPFSPLPTSDESTMSNLDSQEWLPHVQPKKRLARRFIRKRQGRMLLIYAVVLVVTLIYIYPFIYVLNTALKSYGSYLLDPAGLTHTFTWQNFTNAWDQASFATYYANTFLYAGVTTFTAVTFSLLFAFPIARRYVRWSSFWYALFVLALFLPNGLIPQFQLILNIGLYNTQLGYILVSSGFGAGSGLSILLLVGFLKSIPRELDEAAAIDGCSYWQYIWTVIVPLARPALATVAIFQLLTVWNDIIGPVIYLSDPTYYPATLGLFSFIGTFQNNWPLLAAAVLILVAPLVVLFLFLQRYIIAGIMTGALKS